MATAKKLKDGRLVVDFSSLPYPKSKGRDEWSYDCPFCLDVRGKADREGKLKWNPRKHIGSCWKCKTMVVDAGVHDMETVYDLYYRDDGPDAKSRLETQRYTLEGWSKPAREVPWAREYLAKRGFDDEITELYKIRATDHFSHGGLLLPNGYEGGVTNFFQMRNMRPDAHMKYTNPTGADKPVYGLWTVRPETTKAFICEGCFSSIAMNRVDDAWASLATYGKSPSTEQLRTINALPVDELCVVHDGGEIKSLLDTLMDLFSTNKKVSFVLMPFGEDPNSVSLEALRDRFARFRFQTNDRHLDLLRQARRKQKLGDARPGDWAKFVDYNLRLKCVGESAGEALDGL
jgi:hypothetical protein